VTSQTVTSSGGGQGYSSEREKGRGEKSLGDGEGGGGGEGTRSQAWTITIGNKRVYASLMTTEGREAAWKRNRMQGVGSPVHHP